MHSLTRALFASLLMTSGLAFAGTSPIQTAGITITPAPLPGDVVLDYSLVSETSTSVSISFDGIAAESRLVADSSVNPYSYEYAGWWEQFAVHISEGYKLTNLTITGTLYGELRGTDTVSSEMNVTFFVSPPNSWEYLTGAGVSASDLNGEIPFSQKAGWGLIEEGDFLLTLNGYNSQSASWHSDFDPVTGELIRFDTYTAGGLRDLVLTFEVSPVPEPAIWGMLISGLALVGVAARWRSGRT